MTQKLESLLEQLRIARQDRGEAMQIMKSLLDAVRDTAEFKAAEAQAQAAEEQAKKFTEQIVTWGKIQAVKRWMPENATSIMDIGAGDGRVLASFAEKCKNATLYSIEIAPILRQAQPENIVPVGTELFEQNLASLQVDYIFCNPRYSQYEDWVCKIVSEGFAKKAFLVIPQRWTDSNRARCR